MDLKSIKKAFCLLLCLISFQLFSQAEKTIQSPSDKIEGTYQLQVIGTRENPYIPSNLNELVLKNRHKTEVKFIQLGTRVRLMILPESAIKRSDYKPLPQIAHISGK